MRSMTGQSPTRGLTDKGMIVFPLGHPTGHLPALGRPARTHAAITSSFAPRPSARRHRGPFMHHRHPKLKCGRERRASARNSFCLSRPLVSSPSKPPPPLRHSPRPSEAGVYKTEPISATPMVRAQRRALTRGCGHDLARSRRFHLSQGGHHNSNNAVDSGDHNNSENTMHRLPYQRTLRTPHRTWLLSGRPPSSPRLWTERILC